MDAAFEDRWYQYRAQNRLDYMKRNLDAARARRERFRRGEWKKEAKPMPSTFMNCSFQGGSPFSFVFPGLLP